MVDHHLAVESFDPICMQMIVFLGGERVHRRTYITPDQHAACRWPCRQGVILTPARNDSVF